MKKQHTRLLSTIIAALSIAATFLLSSCGTSPEKKSPIPFPNKRQTYARQILANPRITLLKNQVSGRVDGASAYHNIVAAARGYDVQRSSYGNAPGGYVKLETKMLKTMLYLANTRNFTYRVTSIAGGSHSRSSRHYAGIAFDVDTINGQRVSYRHPSYKQFMTIARAKGATEVLGPGDRAHSTHLHFAWPRDPS